MGFTIPTGATVKIQATKPSGFGFSVAGTVSGNAVSFTTTAIMTDEAGRFPAELEITKDSVVIGTANFIMWGEANPHPEGTTDGQQGTIIPELTLLVERVEAAASSVLDMQVVAETLAAGSQATYSYDENLNKATFGIPQGEAGAGAAGVVASAYSSSKTYKVGDYVLHNSNLYRCTTAITTAEAFTAAHWTQIVLADDVSDLKTDLEKATDSKAPQFTNGAWINTGSTIGAVVNLTPTANQYHSYALFNCAEGDRVLINGQTSSTSVRMWAFLDSDNKLLAVANSGIVANDLVVIAPQNTAKCIINLTTATMGVCLYGGLLPSRMTDAENNIDDLQGFQSSFVTKSNNNLVNLGTLEERKYYKYSDGSGNANNFMFSIVGIPVTKYRLDWMFAYSSYRVNDTSYYAPRSVCFYDSNGTFISGFEPYTGSIGQAFYNRGGQVPSNAVTMNLSFYYQDQTAPNKPSIYWANTQNKLIELESLGVEYKVSPSSILNKDEIAKKANFIRARRPLVCFTLDGNYPRNGEIVTIANNHNVKIGLAPKYNSSFYGYPETEDCYYRPEKYLEWQDQGHEILSHMRYNMPESTTYTDEQCIEFIKESYLQMIARGYDIKGAIGSSGAVAERFIPYIQRWYSYASTLANKAEAYGSTPTSLVFESSEPYKLWRYSMQLTTLNGMKQAVDEAIQNNALLIFYGHAQSASGISPTIFEDGDTYGDDPNTAGSTTNLTGTDHFTADNFDALLTYIESKEAEGAITIMTPYDAVNDYYKVRKTDLA